MALLPGGYKRLIDYKILIRRSVLFDVQYLSRLEIRRLVIRCWVPIRRWVQFAVRSFGVRSFGSVFRRSVIRCLVIRCSVFQRSVGESD